VQRHIECEIAFSVAGAASHPERGQLQAVG
jgi:hypothetical protein